MTSHPAPFSDPVLDVLYVLTKGWEGPILDPYAGIGRVHELARDDTFGIEIEPEFAATHPRTFWADSSKVGRSSAVDGMSLIPRRPSRPEEGDLTWVEDPGLNSVIPRPRAIVTSPDYGNRFSDQYLGTPKEVEKRAQTGKQPRRRSYAISLNRPVSAGSTCRYKFGPIWRAMHVKIFTAVTTAVHDDAKLALNVSDFIADGARVPVIPFWIRTIAGLGWKVEDVVPVTTSRFRDGANREARVESEVVLVATLKERV